MNLTHNIDDTLRDFYRSEMPDPWPTMRAPARTLPMPKRSSRPVWLRSLSRLAVAASIALLLIGYLALASLFPRDSAGRTGVNPVSGELGDIGPRPKVKPLNDKSSMPKLDLIPKGFILSDPQR
jgi:hypothetical protein